MEVTEELVKGGGAAVCEAFDKLFSAIARRVTCCGEERSCAQIRPLLVTNEGWRAMRRCFSGHERRSHLGSPSRSRAHDQHGNLARTYHGSSNIELSDHDEKLQGRRSRKGLVRNNTWSN